MKLYAWALLSFLGFTAASPLSLHIGNGERSLVERQTDLNEFITYLLDILPTFNDTIADAVNVLTDVENLVADYTGLQTTYNELDDGAACTQYTVIFARGTTEPGNVGIVAGPPFFLALDSLVGSDALTIQGVNNYAASVYGYLEGGDPDGSANMASQIEQAYNQCPDTQLVAAGYSQGGQIVHNAANLLPTNVANWISSVVIFGDPDSSMPVTGVNPSNVDIICHPTDDICLNGDFILPSHLTYALNALDAANFVVSH